MTVSSRYLEWIKSAAYLMCGIPPYRVGTITPADMIFMISTKRKSLDTRDDTPLHDPMNDEEMEAMIMTVVHPIISNIGGGM